MGTLYIRNKTCPFCNGKLTNNLVNCTQYLSIQCLECRECKIYLYTESNYNILKKLADNKKRKLSRDVYKYCEIETDNTSKQRKTKHKDKKQKVKNKHTKVKRNSNKTINDIPTENVKSIKNTVNYNKVKKCSYFKNGTCIYFDGVCNPYSVKCTNRGILLSSNKTNLQNRKNKSTGNTTKNKGSLQNSKKIKAVILSHNRKCIYEKHNIVDMNAIFKVLISNKIENISISVAYCPSCDQYIILKSDFKEIKKKGVLLCQVIDKTPEYVAKHEKSSYHGTESKVHSLGYNVIKQGYDYTFEQRKIILSNIMENYSITKHEILSMLDINIARKINLPSYADAVKKWKQDREFVANYKLGDCPEVIINEAVIGKRE